MKIKEIINEIFVDYMKGTDIYSSTINRPKHVTEIYLNPSKKELRKLKEIRFTAIKKGEKVYVFDATKGIHDNLEKHLNLRGNEIILKGTAIKKKGEWIMNGSDQLFTFMMALPISYALKHLKTIFSINWSFINKYIKVDEYLKKIKKKVKMKFRR